jgi:hypothetical protein
LELLPSARSTDTPAVGRFVAVVVCAVFVVPAATADTPSSPLLRRASSLTGLRIVHGVRIVRERGSRFEHDVTRALDRNYPRSLQRLDDELYIGLGLLPAEKTIRGTLLSSARSVRAIYDPVTRVLRSRTTPSPAHSELLRELARALVDQNFNLRRLIGLRAQNRDAALAAQTIVDGVAALASGAHIAPLQGTLLQRFLGVEQNAGIEFGKSLVAQLRYLGGRFAVGTALRTFPRTTAQVIQLDRFLQRDPAEAVTLTASAGDSHLSATETFGELDVLALLRTFDIANADATAADWNGGRIALYTGPNGNAVALVLRWDTSAGADQWRASMSSYLAAAFPDATPRLCPAVIACWLDGTRELATAGSGPTTVFTSGVNAELIAATIAGAT